MKKALNAISAIILCLALVITLGFAGVAAPVAFIGYTAITDAASLKNIDNDLAGKYYLANDITLTADWEAIGWLDSDLPFTGIFDGNGKTVSGLKMPYGDAATYVGLFAINSGTIKNLTVSGADISGNAGVGAVVGVNKGTITNVTIKDSKVVGAATSSSKGLRAGGLVGQNGTTGIITDCVVKDTYVEGNRMIGGVVGSNLGSITNCVADGVEINNDMLISDIYDDGAYFWVNSNVMVYSYVGGVVGNNQGTVTECSTAGDIAVYGFEYVGGIVGYNSGTVSKVFMGSATHDIPYYNPYVYGSYSFYAEHVKTGVGYTETGAGTATDVYVIETHTEHSFTEWEIITAATCTQDGLKKRACTACGFKQTEVIPHGHTEGEWTVVTPATCTTEGSEEIYCTVCGELLDTHTIAATGHTEGKWTVVTPATCTAEGSEELYCTVCGELLDTRAIEAMGHSEGEWTVATPSSCTQEGIRELRCTVCGELLNSEAIPVTAHTDADNDGFCDDCGANVRGGRDCNGIIDCIARFFARLFLKIYTAIENSFSCISKGGH